MIITENTKKTSRDILHNRKRICVGSKHKGDYIDIHDVLYVEAFENYSWLHLTGGKKLLSCKPIKHYEDKFVSNGFVRIHRSHLVNLSHVKTYEKRCRLLHLKENIMLSVSHRKNISFSKIIADIKQ